MRVYSPENLFARILDSSTKWTNSDSDLLSEIFYYVLRSETIREVEIWRTQDGENSVEGVREQGDADTYARNPFI